MPRVGDLDQEQRWRDAGAPSDETVRKLRLCRACYQPIGNRVFTVCDDCWDDNRPGEDNR